MDEKEFMRQQAAATERMRRMHERSQFRDDGHTMPPAPDFVRVGGKENRTAKQTVPSTDTGLLKGIGDIQQKQNDFSANGGYMQSVLGDTFFAERLREPDTALILGLLLLLFSENADRRLMFALLYILM